MPYNTRCNSTSIRMFQYIIIVLFNDVFIWTYFNLSFTIILTMNAIYPIQLKLIK
jgi:hypothetical protein